MGPCCFYMNDSGGSDGALLRRSPSAHGPGYDDLLAKGIPRRMLRKAWIVSDSDPDAAMEVCQTPHQSSLGRIEPLLSAPLTHVRCRDVPPAVHPRQLRPTCLFLGQQRGAAHGAASGHGPRNW